MVFDYLVGLSTGKCGVEIYVINSLFRFIDTTAFMLANS